MANDFCHMDLQTTDPEAAKKFYGELFSWELEKMDMPGGVEYTLIKPGEGPLGGIMRQPVEGLPSHWMVYIQVEDVEKSIAKAVELGGEALRGKTPVADVGFIAVVQDPTGAAFALWQPAKKQQH